MSLFFITKINKIMKYIPTLFSTEMVQSEIDGRKKMTRRTKGLERINANPDEWTLTSK